jgi:hypothetical protein
VPKSFLPNAMMHGMRRAMRSPTTDDLVHWLLKHEGISDTKTSQFLRDTADLQKQAGVGFPRTLRGIWNAAVSYESYYRSRVDRVAYCPRSTKTHGVLDCGMRLSAVHGTGLCPGCLAKDGMQTETHRHFQNDKHVPLSFDYFIRADEQYADKCKIPEFTDSIIANYADNLKRLQKPPCDDSVDVDTNLSGIAARKLYQDHPDYFDIDIRDNGRLVIIVRGMSDFQAPYHGSTIVGSFSTGGDNDEVCNIDPKLMGRPEYTVVTHIISGGQHVPNPEQRQEYNVEMYGRMMHEGFRTDVVTSSGIYRNVLVRVIPLNYTADGPKFAGDMSLWDQVEHL